jgi:hypothetical protein
MTTGGTLRHVPASEWVGQRRSVAARGYFSSPIVLGAPQRSVGERLTTYALNGVYVPFSLNAVTPGRPGPGQNSYLWTGH